MDLEVNIVRKRTRRRVLRLTHSRVMKGRETFCLAPPRSRGSEDIDRPRKRGKLHTIILDSAEPPQGSSSHGRRLHRIAPSLISSPRNFTQARTARQVFCVSGARERERSTSFLAVATVPERRDLKNTGENNRAKTDQRPEASKGSSKTPIEKSWEPRVGNCQLSEITVLATLLGIVDLQ